jgi:hypothetical protein
MCKSPDIVLRTKLQSLFITKVNLLLHFIFNKNPYNFHSMDFQFFSSVQLVNRLSYILITYSFLVQGDDVTRIARPAKIVERMVNQNTYDEYAQGTFILLTLSCPQMRPTLLFTLSNARLFYSV